MHKVSVQVDSLEDQVLLDCSKILGELDSEFNEILSKLTLFSKGTISTDSMTLLDQLDKKQQSIQEKKHEYCLDIRQEILRRDISEEKIKRALGLKFELSRFKGYDSEMDIYTFKIQFEKLIKPYVQKRLLSDTLKLNYLSDPALGLVKSLEDTEEIWKRLMDSFGNSRLLLQTKLGVLDKFGAFDKLRGDDKIIHATSNLINTMSELKTIAKKTCIRKRSLLLRRF